MPYVRTRLGRWFYDERGAARRSDDPAIVLCHGLLFDGGMWREQIEPLAALARVVVLDGPGHGKSEVPPPFSLEDHADALCDAFGELRIDRCIFVGLAWGGMIGLRLALRHPQRVRALAVLGASAEAEERARLAKYRLFASFGRRFGLPKTIADDHLVPLFFTESTCATRPDLVERFVRRVNGFPRDGVNRALLAVITRTDILPRLGSIHAPTLVMCGREDRVAESAHSERIARAIAGAKLTIVEGAGHASVLERPGAINDVLVSFVANQLGS